MKLLLTGILSAALLGGGCYSAKPIYQSQYITNDDREIVLPLEQVISDKAREMYKDYFTFSKTKIDEFPITIVKVKGEKLSEEIGVYFTPHMEGAPFRNDISFKIKVEYKDFAGWTQSQVDATELNADCIIYGIMLLQKNWDKWKKNGLTIRGSISEYSEKKNELWMKIDFEFHDANEKLRERYEWLKKDKKEIEKQHNMLEDILNDEELRNSV